MIEFRKEERENFILVKFELSGPISPDVFPEVLNKLEKLNLRYDRGIVVSDRGPIWLYCFIFHRLHPAKWVAVYDPRLGGIVVQSHDPKTREGEIIKVE